MQKHRLKKTVNNCNAEQTDENNNSQENSHQSHEAMDINDEPGPCDSTLSGDLIRSVHSTQIQEENQRNVPFKVKMTFKPKEKTRSMKSKAQRRREQKIRSLQNNLKDMKRKNECLRKRLSRLKRYKQEVSDKREQSTSTSNYETPRRRTRTLLKSSGLSPKRHKSIVRKLQLHETIIDDMIDSDHALNVASKNTVRKSRQLAAVSDALKLKRKKVLRVRRSPTNIQRRKMVERARIKSKVVEFMERDDNSACLPGKSDCVKTKTGKEQKRVLNDLLYNLHAKFRSENPEIKINTSTFGSYRPSRIKLVHFSSRKTCLCQRHQNMALKVKALRSMKITNETTPDAYIKHGTNDKLLADIEKSGHSNIKYCEWQRVEVEHKGRKIKRMQVIQLEKPVRDFVEVMRKTITEFREHCQRVKSQYDAIRTLKESLPTNQAIIQMDFAENYVCSHADEVQSAYFDKGAVTLHPTVIYYRTDEGQLEHKSHVIVSDTAMHNSGAVLAFMKEIVPIAHRLVPNLKMCHYVTDSPTSQYRNKHMFYLVANHQNMFDGVQASWQYFEAGHGKGPCDGVGGTAKRQADSAVKRHICSIQNADDFYAWGVSQSQSNVDYIFVSNTKCVEMSEFLKNLNIKPVKGTMSVHSVVSLGLNSIAVRETSCFCDDCFKDGTFHAKCNGWYRHTFNESSRCDHENDGMDANEYITDSLASGSSKSIEPTEPIETAAVETTGQQYEVNSYVAALYDEQWYIGLVQDDDPDDDTYCISFMTKGSNPKGVTLKWPDKEDVVWRASANILCAVAEPIMYGKRRKVYKLTPEDTERVQNLI